VATAYTLSYLAANQYDKRVTTVISPDRHLGGDDSRTWAGISLYWVLNGIEVWDNTWDPGVQALRLAEASVEPSVVGGQASAIILSPSRLAPVVDQAIGLWTASGLSSEQVALLRSIPVGITDLEARGY